MTDAPKTVGLVHNGFGGWRLWTADDADDPTVVAVPYILASEHKRLLAERDRLRAVLDGALVACRIVDAVAREGHEKIGDLVLHMLSAVEPARAALEGDSDE